MVGNAAGLAAPDQTHQPSLTGANALLPVLVAPAAWPSRLAGSRVVYYVDNEGVREALVKKALGVRPFQADADRLPPPHG